MKTITLLMPHQRCAIEKMLPTRIGALFCDMGVGKSRMAIELVAQRQEQIDTVLWFCPVSLKETIRAEILKHTDCGEQDINVFDDRTDEQHTPHVFWHIIGIESMSASDRMVLAAYSLISEQSMVIVDESSYIKGHNAMRSLRITKLADKARYRLILTGTPMSQGIVDLYAQMRFLSPKILGYSSFYSFAANHLEYDEERPGLIIHSHNIPYLTAKIAPYTYQITKEECLDLPAKCYETRYFRMTDEQSDLYAQAKEEIFAEMEDGRDWLNSIRIFRLFTILQQIVCGFWQQQEIAHRRIDTLLDVLTAIPEREKVIIWAKYQHDIKAISAALQQRYGTSSLALFHGGLSERQRNEQITLFRQDARFFLATQSCGGHGLTLNEACHVVYYNNAFKYSERLQSEDRCHRIGQERKTLYIDIQCSPSIDDRIARALETKGDVVEAFKREVAKTKDAKRMREMIEGL